MENWRKQKPTSFVVSLILYMLHSLLDIHILFSFDHLSMSMITWLHRSHRLKIYILSSNCYWMSQRMMIKVKHYLWDTLNITGMNQQVTIFFKLFSSCIEFPDKWSKKINNLIKPGNLLSVPCWEQTDFYKEEARQQFSYLICLNETKTTSFKGNKDIVFPRQDI